MSEAEEVMTEEAAVDPDESTGDTERGLENDEGHQETDNDKDDRQKTDDDAEEHAKDDQEKDENAAESAEKGLKELEMQEEAKLRAKYPEMKGHGASSFLQKRLSKGTKYFDSGDYNMAKAKVGSSKPTIGPGQKVVLPGPTGDAIPTPETVPHKKISLLQSKLVNMS